MLSKTELKRIAHARLTDAETLLAAGRFDGAAYLCGYAIEIGLKLRICKTLKWGAFPETKREFEGLQSFQTHNLDRLLSLSGIEIKIKQQYLADWSVVKTWKSESRYSPIGTMTKSDVTSLIDSAKTILKLL